MGNMLYTKFYGRLLNGSRCDCWMCLQNTGVREHLDLLFVEESTKPVD